MWLITATAALGLAAIAARWRSARPPDRLLAWWVLLGFAELVVHDSGNERRYVMLIPALAGLAALVLGHSQAAGLLPERIGRRARWMALPFVLGLAYLVGGGLARLAFLYEVRPGVHLSAAVALGVGLLIVWRWKAVYGWLSRQRMTLAGAIGITALAVIGDLAQYGQWARVRTDLNFQASKQVGRLLPEGTLVQGKLANGLSLENRIRPIFVGRGFGNYADRANRDDIRYVLTYVMPRIGYEGSIITDVLKASPRWGILASFDVAETFAGHDRAALIDKFPDRRDAPSPAGRPPS
jgi:hypothetical protein